jgi:phosphoribosyl 1,2-cyclic phosphodiesterase
VRLASLGSGSRGNATLLEAGDSRVLIDCGFSLRDLRKRAARLGFNLRDLDAILVTHEHSDHCSGVAALARHCGAPVYLTHGTWASGRLDGCEQVHLFNADETFRIGDIDVFAVAVPHDAREPVQFRFTYNSQQFGVLTDLGSVTPHVSRAFSGCDALVLEFNHDPRMLAQGPYPPALKRRVGGDWGHLSNMQALELLSRVDTERLQALVIAHTSDKNNSRECITAAIAELMPGLMSRVIWASQDDGLPWLELGGDTAAFASRTEVSRTLESEGALHAY